MASIEEMAAPESSAHGQSADEQIRALQLTIQQLTHNLDQISTPLWQKYLEYEAAKYDEQIAMIRVRIALYHWQQVASTVMLVMTVIVVITGLGLSWYQLQTAIRLGRNTDGSFEVSAKQIRLTSSVVGLVILAMSIAFVLIFVQQVYQIHDPTGTAIPLNPPSASRN